MSSLSWSVILSIDEVFVHLPFSGEKKLTRNQVDISSVKFHSSHSKGKRKQFLPRIILAQSRFYIYLAKPLSKVHVSNNRSNTDYDPQDILLHYRMINKIG